MGKPYDIEYNADASRKSCGEMICVTCRKPIIAGRFKSWKRFRHGDWFYMNQHESCCPDDDGWTRIDAALEARAKVQAERREACRQFVAATGIVDLSDYLSDEEIGDAVRGGAPA